MYYVSIAAYSGHVGENHRKAVTRLLDRLRFLCNDIAIVVGGYEGLMKHVVDVALSMGLKVIIIPPIEWEDREFPKQAIVVKTGTTFTVRSIFIVHTSDALIAVGGGSGSLHEILAAYSEGKPVYVLVGTGLPTDMLEKLPDRIDYRVVSSIKKYYDPEELVRDLCVGLLKSKKN